MLPPSTGQECGGAGGGSPRGRKSTEGLGGAPLAKGDTLIGGTGKRTSPDMTKNKEKKEATALPWHYPYMKRGQCQRKRLFLFLGIHPGLLAQRPHHVLR